MYVFIHYFVCFLGDNAKARLTRIKSHDFEMVNALWSGADQVFNSLKTLMKEQFVGAMKRFVYDCMEITVLEIT